MPIFGVEREIIGSLVRPPDELPSFERNKIREHKKKFHYSI
jgi:hypothetical protein